MLAGFEAVTARDITLNDRSLRNVPPFRRNMGIVFQNYALFPHKSVFQNVAFPLVQRRTSKPAVRAKVEAALRMVDLSGLGKRRPRQLSGGQQQRVALARALVFEPEMVLMDEPLGALDKKLREQMQIEIMHLHEELGMTVAYVTHDQGEALTMSDRVAILNDGLIQQVGSPHQVYEEPANAFVANFIGENNSFEGRIERIDGRECAVRLASGDVVRARSATPRAKGEAAVLSLRPERLAIDPAGEDTANRLRGNSRRGNLFRCAQPRAPRPGRAGRHRRACAGRRGQPCARARSGSRCRLVPGPLPGAGAGMTAPVGMTDEGKAGPADRSLEAKLRRAQRCRSLNAFLLVAPLLLFILVVFPVPILSLLYFSVDDPKLAEVMPRTAEIVAEWDGAALPGEKAYATVVEEIRAAYADRTVAAAAMRLNYEISGFRSMVMRTRRKIRRIAGPSYKEALIGLDERWGDITYWRAVKASAGPYTTRYLLAAVDLERRWDGSIGRAPPERTIYIDYLERTFWISFWVLACCIAVGYPMAYLVATTGRRLSRILLALVPLPFWTSLLVRTAAWVVLLQNKGIANDFLLYAGFIDEPLTLIFNRTGVYIAMVHILLPFLVLPLYAVMRNIPASQIRAAASLGAKPMAAFLSVYLPQTLPGLGAGCILVFVLSLGF